MQFAYDGFIQQDNIRCFRFHRICDEKIKEVFQIQVGLRLFSQHRVLVQDGPRFCLKLLNAVSVDRFVDLTQFHNYRVVSTDFTSLLAERAQQVAAKQIQTRSSTTAIPKRMNGSFAYLNASIVRP